MKHAESPDALAADLTAAAIRCEGKGQLNIAKILHAASFAITRRAAASAGLPDESAELVEDLRALANRLAAAGIDAETVGRVALGARLVAEGKPSFHDLYPDPFVCRRCGWLAERLPEEPCPPCGAHPLTVQRFAPVYWMHEFSPRRALERLRANPGLIQEAVDRLPADRLEWIPPGARWAAANVLRHLRDAESLLNQRIRLILEQDDPPLVYRPVFDQSMLPPDDTPAPLAFLDTYLASRSDSVSRLEGVEAEAWLRTGRHQEMGRVTLAEQASYFAAHELTHLRQLEMLRRAALDAVGGSAA